MTDCNTAALIKAAERYMLAVERLGERSGYDGMTFFECPILSMPDADLGMEAVRRWRELNDAGIALAKVCEIAAADREEVGDRLKEMHDALNGIRADAEQAIADEAADIQEGGDHTLATARMQRWKAVLSAIGPENMRGSI